VARVATPNFAREIVQQSYLALLGLPLSAAVDELVIRWTAEGTEVRRITSDVAFHSPQMDPLLAGLAAATAALAPRPAAVPMLSTALEQIRAALRLPAADLDPRRPLPDLGLDSILKMVIRR
jgi:6-methylsalicylic acid synthase